MDDKPRRINLGPVPTARSLITTAMFRLALLEAFAAIQAEANLPKGHPMSESCWEDLEKVLGKDVVTRMRSAS